MANVVYMEGFETIGTETGLANQAVTAPRVALRYTSSYNGLSPAQDSFYPIDDPFGEGYALCMGTGAGSGGCNILREFPDDIRNGPADPDNTPVITVGLRIHVSSRETEKATFWEHRGAFTSPFPTFNDNCINFQQDGADLIINYGSGGSARITTEVGVFTLGNWHYVELQYLLLEAGDGGFCKVWVDNTEVFTDADDYNNGMQGAGAEPMYYFKMSNYLSLIGRTATEFLAYDDIYIVNGQDRLGLTRVLSLPPISDVSAAWTPDTGPDNYARVDENGADDPPTGYVATTTVDATDKYGVTARSTTKDIFAAKVEVEAVDNDTSDPNLQLIIDSGGSEGTTTEAVTDDANYAVFESIEGSAPSGGDWTETTVSAARVGMRHK